MATNSSSHVNGGGHAHHEEVQIHVASHPAHLEDLDVESANTAANRPAGNSLAEYEGKSVLYMNGKLVCGPPGSYRMVLMTLCLILIPSLLYLSKPAVFLSSRVSPALPLGAVILLLGSLGALAKCSTTDPGILPRSKRVPNAPTPLFPILHTFTFRGVERRLKYCGTCRIYRPQRASHCPDCDNCVLDMDHHCPWLGTCIGRRNYRFFLAFLLATTSLCVYVPVTCAIAIRMDNAERGGGSIFDISNISRYLLEMILVVYCFCIVWSVGILLFFHCYLLVTGQTTREYIKSQEDDGQLAVGSRCYDVCCAHTPSYIDTLATCQPCNTAGTPSIPGGGEWRGGRAGTEMRQLNAPSAGASEGGDFFKVLEEYCVLSCSDTWTLEQLQLRREDDEEELSVDSEVGTGAVVIGGGYGARAAVEVLVDDSGEEEEEEEGGGGGAGAGHGGGGAAAAQYGELPPGAGAGGVGAPPPPEAPAGGGAGANGRGAEGMEEGGGVPHAPSNGRHLDGEGGWGEEGGSEEGGMRRAVTPNRHRRHAARYSKLEPPPSLHRHHELVAGSPPPDFSLADTPDSPHSAGRPALEAEATSGASGPADTPPP